MHEVRLGSTDLVVSTISFGTWAFGGDWGAFDRDDARATIEQALDAGINLFDTAQAYGFGEAERFLGESLWRRVRRDEVVIATKGGLRMDGDHLVRDAGAGWLRRGVEDSLRNLGVDHIDLYQVHWPDDRTPAEETAGVLAELVQEGKIRHVGVSNYDIDQLDELRQQIRVDAVQPAYHLFRRDIEADLLPYCATHGIGVLVYGPLAHGMLAGAMTPDTTFPADDWRSHSPDFAGEAFARNLLVVESLRALAELRGLSLVELAVAWTLSHPAVDVAIVGARRPAQLDASVRAVDVKLTDEDRGMIDRILTTAVPVRGPSPEGMEGADQS
jgi:aryl-alcohol dehydrogenase-like predicted oxidoreductase